MPLHERLLQELLRLLAQRPFEHQLEAVPQLLVLARRQPAVVVQAEQRPERGQISEQRTERVHVPHEAPDLGQRVLNRRRGQQQDGGLVRLQQRAQPMRGLRLPRVVAILAELVEALVDPGKDLVRLVDHAQVEGAGSVQLGAAALAAQRLATDQKHTFAGRAPGARVRIPRLDPEHLKELLPPLPEQRLRCHQQDAPCSLAQELGDHQPGLDGLAQPNFVREDASPLANS